MMDLGQRIAIILLAAGSSSRMKRTKQLLPWKNSTLLGNAIQTALGSEAHTVVVVLGAYADAIRARLERSNENRVKFLENETWEYGLGSSIACGIRYIKEEEIVYDAALVMLADQPFIDSEYLNIMMANFAKSRAAIVATAYEKRAGVPALFSRFHFENLALLNDDKGAQKLINDPRQEALILNPGEKTVDIDTKLEYENLIKRLNENP